MIIYIFLLLIINMFSQVFMTINKDSIIESISSEKNTMTTLFNSAGEKKNYVFSFENESSLVDFLFSLKITKVETLNFKFSKGINPFSVEILQINQRLIDININLSKKNYITFDFQKRINNHIKPSKLSFERTMIQYEKVTYNKHLNFSNMYNIGEKNNTFNKTFRKGIYFQDSNIQDLNILKIFPSNLIVFENCLLNLYKNKFSSKEIDQKYFNISKYQDSFSLLNQIKKEMFKLFDKEKLFQIKIVNSAILLKGKIHYLSNLNVDNKNHPSILLYKKRKTQGFYFDKIEITCSNYNDCYNCSAAINNLSKPICTWSKDRCLSMTNGTLPFYWWRLFDKCNDDSSKAIMKLYCGDDYLNIPTSIELPSVNNMYGARNMYCKYSIYSYASTPVLFQFSKYYLNQDLYGLSVTFDDGSIKTDFIQSPSIQWSSEGIKKYEIFYYSSNAKRSKPFKINFLSQTSSGFNYLGLFISIGILVFVCFICSIIFYKCSRRIIEQNQQNRLRRIEIHREVEPVIEVHNEVNREQNIRQKNTLLLENLFKEELKPHTYTDKENEYTSNCTICLENFNEKSVVNVLPCHHIFHNSCLKEWLFKNIFAVPKCPNCNTLISSKWEIQENEIREHQRQSNNIIALNIIRPNHS